MTRARLLARYAAVGIPIAACMVLDVAMLSSPEPFVAFCVVAALALVAAQLRSAPWTVAAGTASLVVTVVFAIGPRISAISLTECLALLALLGQRWRRRRGAGDIALVGLLGVAVVLLPLRAHAEPGSYAVTAATVGLALAVASAVRDLDVRRSRDVDRMRLRERESMSRELHDLVAHHVTGVVVAAQAAQLDADPDRMRAALAAIEGAGREALAVTRRLATTLRADDEGAEASDGTEDLATLFARFEAARVAGELRTRVPALIADPVVATAVHRITQEGLTNIQHHARGAELVEVRIDELDSGSLAITIADSGGRRVREPDETRAHWGLVGMRERAEELGGTFEAGPHGDGWRVRATLPRRTG